LALATRLEPALRGPGQLLPVSALGFLELSLDSPAGTHRYLGALAEAVPAIGLGDPGLFRSLPDEVEALVALGQPAKAEPLVAWLEERGTTLRRPWALATGARCRALLLAAEGDLDGAMVALREALSHHEGLPVPFELGRTLLVQGRVQRRARQWGDARACLQRALGIFEKAGAPLWSEKAREGLRRIGGRPPAPLQLTQTEQRVAELVAAGATNREVAQRLFMTVKTVEATLSRIYRKLGVRSRTELGARYAQAYAPPTARADKRRDSPDYERPGAP
jgi:DNA-binding CsgD family transcriptional regulator